MSQREKALVPEETWEEGRFGRREQDLGVGQPGRSGSASGAR